MPDNPNKFTRFWNELKRRKVLRVALVYASTAFILLQLIDILLDPLHLPEWVMTFFVVLLLVGFPIAVIFAWVFDMTPTGIEVTKSENSTSTNDQQGIFSRRYLVFDIIIGVLLVIVIVLAYPKLFKGKSTIDPNLEKTIAVLPIKNLSEDKSNENLANGIMWFISDNLRKIKDIEVRSQQSVEQYRNSASSVQQISNDINANYIVNGSCQRHGSQFMLNITLLEGKNDKIIWTDHFVRDITAKDFIGLQMEVAKQIADGINANITAEEEKRIETVHTNSTEALELYLQARSDWFKYLGTGDPSLIENSQNSLTEAIILDPDFSKAYADLGIVHCLLAHFSPLPPKEHWDDALKMLYTAIEKNPDEGFAYSYLGVVQTLYLHDSTQARNSFNKALELIPNESQPNGDLCYFESRLGNCEHLNRRMEILRDNFSQNTFNAIGVYFCKLHTCQGNSKGIVQRYNQRELEGKSYTPRLTRDHMIINAFIQEGNFEKAMMIAEMGRERIKDQSYIVGNIGIVHAMQGNKESALAALQELDEISKHRYVSPTIIAAIYAALGNKEEALKYLEKGIDDRDWRVLDMFEFAPFYQKRNEPWLQDIIRKSWTPIKEGESA